MSGKLAFCTINKTSTPPSVPPTIHTCVRWIAQLGGFLGRKRDREPGVKTIWQGLRRLHDIAATWIIASSHSQDSFGSKLSGSQPYIDS